MVNESQAHIAIIGTGQLGSRHLQGLSMIGRAIKITVIDPNPASLEIAQKRYEEMPASKFDQSVIYAETMHVLDKDVDVAIISTNADVRRNAVEELLKHVSVQFMILEKVAFQSVEDFRAVIELLEKNETKAWVNCTRRMCPVFRKMRREFAKQEYIDFRLEGDNWGMACNTIHMLDLFAFLTDETQFSIDTSGIDKKVYRSNKNGFIELGGVLSATTSRGDRLTLIDDKGSSRRALFEISSENHCYTIFQSKGKIVSKHKESEWAALEQRYVILNQSELTHLVVQMILDSGECDLTPINESFALHKPLLEAFASHLEMVTGKKYIKCPIT
ncbi:MAG: Gfo/Idh/MocA family oxidoreductase [Candidatus Scalindua sp.]|jgi:predicted dehydrogenase|nr:Gfo/Idh/MocA family oxidoreductase [Candidatus Scalindua sp.]